MTDITADTTNPPPSPLEIAALELRLPSDAYYHLINTLRIALPDPPDNPEDRTRRDHAIVAQISALRPADTAEAGFAAQIAAANETWADCLRWAKIHLANQDHARADKSHARAASFMRQSHGALRALLRLQEARRKLHADPTATDIAERAGHITTVMLAEALADLNTRPEPPRPPSLPAPPPPSAPQDVSPREPKSRATRIETLPRCAALFEPRKGTAKDSPKDPSPEIPDFSPAKRALLNAHFYGKREYDPRRPSAFYPFKRGGTGLANIPPYSPPPPFDDTEENAP